MLRDTRHTPGPQETQKGGVDGIREAKLRLTPNEQRLLLFGADDCWMCSLIIQSTARVANAPNAHVRGAC